MDTTDFDKLKKKIFEDRGFDFNQYGQEYVKRRLNVRIMALGIARDDWQGYLKVIEKEQEAEYLKLFDAFSVNVTEFFRDATAWKALREKYLPMMIAEKLKVKPSHLRIWSAACSSGEEPYSVAMLMKEILPRGLTLSITATDIDDDALNKARQGIYKKEALKNAEAGFGPLIQKYFRELPAPQQPLDSQKYQLSDEIRNMVVFQKHNFLSEQPLAQIDIIFCRNVMIYLSPKVKEKLFETFYKALLPHGMFVVGKSEIIFLGKGKDYFYALDSKEHIYRKERRSSEEPLPDNELERRKHWWPARAIEGDPKNNTK
ncbi:MAG: hypothetical protein A2339_07775 [Elusimicrobia bacterium RIFOXYB12_FULL_50_12]|nr:MAG: hypothetical protein A2278_02955 [Elusimicrobia bacterium RIFOXYA12_FULL_49_49]OGS10137.1 MAG: hypothetical protein A2386_02905 [Elusimicrobia bacterium RIFOXYB1_FULL_48_9]OGS16441.1 MAG: hypothetical protein A2251_06410 [Elusimicrobia bacterium RIFOXYA2_FULL_47_53]OGS27184.1 MAG: hypothetical protein A2339_07775 [Elusimicrobia bacterium RIFOXYB12_FULL_50_12]OGS30383.1 MAG: hypothetical protein A2323_02635 [Elusimicrobia bacterium RIFOXYB2_FULL_46_23]